MNTETASQRNQDRPQKRREAERVEVGRARAERHQHVHVARAVAQRAIGGAVEASAVAELHGRRQHAEHETRGLRFERGEVLRLPLEVDDLLSRLKLEREDPLLRRPRVC